MALDLSKILDLVGTLGDGGGDNTPRCRFRSYLQSDVTQMGSVRDYVETCLKKKGSQYDFALQDLVNHVGSLIGFDVTYGRYRGVKGQIGYDGLWHSQDGNSLVVEVKTTDAFAIKISALLGYMNSLVEESLIIDNDHAYGLYVIGRSTPGATQLEDSIIAKKLDRQLRIVSVDSLLALAEVYQAYEVEHDEVAGILTPSGPSADPVISVIAKLVSEPRPDSPPCPRTPGDEPEGADKQKAIRHWLTPVKSHTEESAEECIESLVGHEGVYAFSAKSSARSKLRRGDRICFYANGIGVVAYATIASDPVEMAHPKVHDSEHYRWLVDLVDTSLFLDTPNPVDASMRQRLDAFEGKDLTKPWSWFVQSAKVISAHDFDLLTAH